MQGFYPTATACGLYALELYMHLSRKCVIMGLRSEIITKIDEQIAGRLSAAALANWAFDMFYAIEQGEVTEADSDLVVDVLDELMFADEALFALGEADLRRLIARLEQP